jgi:hypothetical protein
MQFAWGDEKFIYPANILVGKLQKTYLRDLGTNDRIILKLPTRGM